MKVVAFNGSPRKDGNTAVLIERVFAKFEKEGIKSELVQLSGKKIQGCIAWRKCRKNKNQRCAVEKDILNDCIEKMLEADGIILGSPTYFTDVTTEMKALIGRSGMVSKVNDDMLKRKAGASVVVARRAGAIRTWDTLNHFFLGGRMMVVGSSYWNVGFGREKGEVEKNEEGMQTMSVLGQNFAWLLKKIHA